MVKRAGEKRPGAQNEVIAAFVLCTAHAPSFGINLFSLSRSRTMTPASIYCTIRKASQLLFSFPSTTMTRKTKWFFLCFLLLLIGTTTLHGRPVRTEGHNKGPSSHQPGSQQVSRVALLTMSSAKTDLTKMHWPARALALMTTSGFQLC